MTTENIDFSKMDAAQDALLQAIATQGDINLWSPSLVITLTVIVLVFGCIVLALGTHLIRKSNSSGVLVIKFVGLVMITVFSVVLMIVGYNKDQLTPVVGLFGTIAGFLLGKGESAARDG